MTEERPSQVLGSLPRSRPHRRSDKRSAPVGGEERAAETPPAASSRERDEARPAKAVHARAGGARAGTRQGRAQASKPKKAAGSKPKTATARSAAGGASAAKRRGGSARLGQPPQPRGTPARKAPARPRESGGRPEVVGTAVQAAAELAELGLSISARVLRGAISRLPRP